MEVELARTGVEAPGAGGAQEPGSAFDTRPDLRAPRYPLPTFTHAELRAMVDAGEGQVEACERILAQSTRMLRAVELGIGDLLAALTQGDRLGRLGFSNVGDYAENIWKMRRRTAQLAVQLSKGLRERPLLRAGVYAGKVSPRAALAVFPRARGEDEALWTERAIVETVRRLEKLVREDSDADEGAGVGSDSGSGLAAGPELEEPYVPIRIPLSRADRKDLDVALALAAELHEVPLRAGQLEAIAQEYLGEHPLDEDETTAAEAAVLARMSPTARGTTRRDEVERTLEEETDRWAHLDPVRDVPALEVDPNACATAEELDATLGGLFGERDAWQDLVGYCAHVVKATRGHKQAGFVDFRHYADERLGMAPRTVEQRAALEQKLWANRALQAARERGLGYSKLALVAALPEKDAAEFAAKAEKLTVVELREAVAAKLDAQMCAREVFEAWVPRGVAFLVEQALQAARKAMKEEATQEAAACERCKEARRTKAHSGCHHGHDEPDDGACLGRLARHFNLVWGADVIPPRTISQKQRAKVKYCQFPGCTRRAVHGHHIIFRSQGGSDDPSNILPACAYHHLAVIHGGLAEVSGTFPDALEFTVGGKRWVDAKFGRDGPAPGEQP